MLLRPNLRLSNPVKFCLSGVRLKVLVSLPSGIEERAHSPLAGVRERLHKMLSAAFVQQVLAMYVTRIVLIGIGLVTTVIVARILGPEGRGLYAVAMAIGAIGVQCGTLGLHTVNSYAVAKDRSSLPGLLGNTLAASAIVGALALMGTYTVLAIWPKLAPLHGQEPCGLPG